LHAATGLRQLAANLQRVVLTLQWLALKLQPRPLTPVRVLRDPDQLALDPLPMPPGVQRLRLDPRRPVHGLEPTVLDPLSLLPEPECHVLDLPQQHPGRQAQRPDPVGRSPGRPRMLHKPERRVHEGFVRRLGAPQTPPTSL
jgi:hypothetical protein